MINLQITEELADEVFEVLQAIATRAKDNKDNTVLLYVLPIMMSFGDALIKAKPGKTSRQLPRFKKMKK